MFKEQIKALIYLDVKAGRVPPDYVNPTIVDLVSRSIFESYDDVHSMLSNDQDSCGDWWSVWMFYRKYLKDAPSVKTLIASGLFKVNDDRLAAQGLVGDCIISVYRKSGHVNLDDEVDLGQLCAEQILDIVRAMSIAWAPPSGTGPEDGNYGTL